MKFLAAKGWWKLPALLTMSDRGAILRMFIVRNCKQGFAWVKAGLSIPPAGGRICA